MLYDSQGELVSTRVVDFNTTNTNFTRGAQDGVPKATPSVARSLPLIGSISCAKKCPNLCVQRLHLLVCSNAHRVFHSSFDLWCFLTRNCLGFLFRVLGIAALVLCCCCCCCKACRKGSCLRSVLCGWCSCLKRSKDGVSNKMKNRVAKSERRRSYSDETARKDKTRRELPAIHVKIDAPQAPAPVPMPTVVPRALIAPELDEALARPGSFAYFNVARSAPVARMGSRFSLLGLVKRLPDARGVLFDVSEFPLQTMETVHDADDDLEAAYRVVERPRPLPRSLLCTELSFAEAATFISLRPRHCCINKPIVNQ